MDKKDKKIITELVRNPKITNLEIEKITGIPEKTISRRRQKISQDFTNLYLEVNNTNDGTKLFQGTACYTITFQNHITRKQLLDKIENGELFQKVPQKHLKHAFLADSIDKIQLMIVIETFNHNELIEILNADIIPVIKQHLGEFAIQSVSKKDNFKPLILFNNYSIKKGKPVIKEDIYVTE